MKQHSRGHFVSFSVLLMVLLALFLTTACASAWDPMGISAHGRQPCRVCSWSCCCRGSDGLSTSVVGSPTISVSLITRCLRLIIHLPQGWGNLSMMKG